MVRGEFSRGKGRREEEEEEEEEEEAAPEPAVPGNADERDP